MHFGRGAGAGTFVVAIWLWSSALAAQAAAASDPPEQRARERRRAGEELSSKGRPREALAAFLEAYRLQPDPALQLKIAVAHEQLGEVSRALAAYREYLYRAQAHDAHDEAQARVVQLARGLSELGLQQVSFRTTPAGATVLVDARVVGLSPTYVDLAPGSHRVEFRHDGRVPAAYEFELTARQPLNIETALAIARPTTSAAPATVVANVAAATPETLPDSGPGKAVSPPRSRDAIEASSALRAAGFVAIGASVAALGAALTLELMRSHTEGQARQETQQVRFAAKLDKMRSQQTMARVVAGGALVLAAAGGVLLALVASEGGEPPSEDALSLGCTPAACAASYSGRF